MRTLSSLLATVYSRAAFGMQAPPVIIDVHLSSGLPALLVVGLAEGAVKEAKDRVRSAIQLAGFEWPPGRITVNLSPADLPKEGGRFDLPIALGIIAARGHLPSSRLALHEFYGELSLGGDLRAVRGILSAICAAALEARPVILPRGNLPEAERVQSARVIAAANLAEVVGHVRGDRPLPESAGQATGRRQEHARAASPRNPAAVDHRRGARDGEGDVRERTGLSRRILEPTPVPLAAPHELDAALVGGGSQPAPGEISLAHNGVLFLDELPEFERETLEALREPLETARITISRAAYQSEFPARFQLVAAMNPCPCGHCGDGTRRCRCSSLAIERYRARLSGPLLDRLDLHVRVKPTEVSMLLDSRHVGDSSAVVRLRVARARARQVERQGVLNSALSPSDLERHAAPDRETCDLLQFAAAKLNLSARAYGRILRVARTIADLAGADAVTVHHVSEALLFRQLDAEGLDTLIHSVPYARSHETRPGVH